MFNLEITFYVKTTIFQTKGDFWSSQPRDNLLQVNEGNKSYHGGFFFF